MSEICVLLFLSLKVLTAKCRIFAKNEKHSFNLYRYFHKFYHQYLSSFWYSIGHRWRNSKICLL